MANDRRTYTLAEEVALTTQVGGDCPLCGKALFYIKRSRSYKNYELAHIYPLNPTPEEIEELKAVPLLNADVNHPDNQIPLCTECHTKFDKPRTRGEYADLYKVKKGLLERQAQKALFSAYPLEAEIGRIVTSLQVLTVTGGALSDLSLDAKSLEDKFDKTLSGLTRRRIKNAVGDYYQHVRDEFKRLEQDVPSSAILIFSQVRTYYLKQKSLGLSQQAVFANVVEWIRVSTNPKIDEAAEIVAAFFVQNCEVFE